MYQSNWSFNMPPPPLLGNPRTFELLKIGLFTFPPLGGGGGKPLNAPPISTEIPFLKDKYRLQANTVHTFQREICCNDTFKLHLKTLLRERQNSTLEICQTLQKPTKLTAYYARTKDKAGSNSPPFQGNVQISPPRALCAVKYLRYAGGGGRGCWSFNLTSACQNYNPKFCLKDKIL